MTDAHIHAHAHTPLAQVMSRPAGYRYGSWLVFHGSGAYLVGFSTACWLRRDHDNQTVSMGLWARCQDSRCSRLDSKEVPDWLVATRVLGCVSVVLVALWLVVSCQCHCLTTRQQRRKWMVRLEEYLSILSGCVALLSVGVFAVSSATDMELADFSLSWSLWLVVGGASGSAVGGCIVAVTRSHDPLTPKPSTRTIRPANSNAVGGVRGGYQTGETNLSGARLNLHPHPHPVGRRDDVSGIFNVISFTRGSDMADIHRGRNSSQCWAEMGDHPPPYSVARLGATGEGNPALVGPGRGGSSSPVYDLNLYPPPPYESLITDPPPPYEPHVSPPACPSVQLVTSRPSD